MKKKLFLAKLYTILAVFLLILSVFVFLSLNNSAAWFSLNNKTTANGMLVQMSDEDSVVQDVKYYKIADIRLKQDENDTTKYHNEYIFQEKITEPTLPYLSAIDPMRQVLIKIKLKEGKTSVSVRAKTNDATAGYPTTFTRNTNNASSIIQFQTVAKNAVVGDEAQGYEILATESFLDTTQSFAEVSSAEQDGTVAINKTLKNDLMLYTTPEGQADNEIFIVLDYYEPSTTFIIDEMNNGRITEGEGKIHEGKVYIPFQCDFSIIIAENK